MRAVVSARLARRLGRAVVFGGGGAGAAAAGFYGFLHLEGRLARRTIGVLPDGAPDADGTYYPAGSARTNGGAGRRPPLSFVVIGDSAAAGLGVSHADETPGALLAQGLAELAGRPVRLRSVAVSGANSNDLADQVTAGLAARPDVALIIIGGNDVTHRVRRSTSARLLADAVAKLRHEDCAVVVGTCPDLGTIEPIPQPLRWLVRLASRRLAETQTAAVLTAGGRPVSLGAILGPEFHAAPSDMFAHDRFHPSPAGYAATAAILFPALATAIGLYSEDGGEDALPLTGAPSLGQIGE